MKRLLVFLLLAGWAEAIPSVPTEVYPPDGVVLLLNRKQVTLRWKLPPGTYTAELWSEGNKLREMHVVVSHGTSANWQVAVENGRSYGWILRSSQGVYAQGGFGVAGEFGFSANGRDGAAGRPGPEGTAGRPGSSGQQVEAELKRDEAGMHLRILSGNRRQHYLFAEPDLHFKITARGGDGGKGADGDNFRGYQAAVGRDGGPAGWGGNCRITTYDAPWRDYLEIDLSPGKPGDGGKGGKYQSTSGIVNAPDGRPGRAGEGGRVDTHLGP
jgi:hypothetical protein